MSKLKLTFGCWNYDRTRALMDGSVQPDGIDLNYLNMPVEETFFRMLRHKEFDVAEMSLSSYSVSMSREPRPFVAIPVFPSRFFRHSCIYVNAKSGIRQAKDLIGKRVGNPEYQMTAPVWIRGILQEKEEEIGSLHTQLEKSGSLERKLGMFVKAIKEVKSLDSGSPTPPRQQPAQPQPTRQQSPARQQTPAQEQPEDDDDGEVTPEMQEIFGNLNTIGEKVPDEVTAAITEKLATLSPDQLEKLAALDQETLNWALSSL
jgi:hypothetical protein